jgi:hypothetical protein
MENAIPMGGETQESDRTEIADNLTLLEQQLAEDSLAARFVQAFRDSDEPSEALIMIVEKRLEKLREEYAAPESQDD